MRRILTAISPLALLAIAFIAATSSSSLAANSAVVHQKKTTPAAETSPAREVPAVPEAQASEPTATPEPASLHEALDRRFRYSKAMQSEFGVFGGDYLGDEWFNTWDVGARYYLHLNNTIALGAEYFYSPIRADSTGDFGKSLTTKQTHTLTAGVLLSNDAAFRAGSSVIECDLMLTLGGGAMQINRKWKPVALIGGGLKVYTPAPWFAVRFDVNSYLHATPKPVHDSFNADVVIDAGVSFLFPTKKIEEKPAKK